MSALGNLLAAWAALTLIGAAASVALISRGRRKPLNRSLHVALGIAVPVLALVHSMAAMSQGGMRLLNSLGATIATVALGAAVVQVLLGQALSDAQGQQRVQLRRLHYGSMLALAGLAGFHAWSVM